MGLNGVAYLDYIEQSLEIHREEGHVENIEVDKGEPLRRELEHFILIASNGDHSPSSGENGRYVLSVAMAAMKSYKHGSTITLS